MIRPLVIMALCGVVASAANPVATGPVVIELFTAEGCPGCLNAERMLDRFANNPGVILLGEHVDYWDNAGWKDPFSSPLFSTRQMDYANALGLRSLTSPQVVIDGDRELTDPRMASISSAIHATRGPRVPVTVKWAQTEACARRNECSDVILTVGALPAGSHKAEVLLAIAESGLESTVLGGLNAGRNLRHAAVVRTIMRLAEADPAKPGEYAAQAHLNLRPEWVRRNLKVVVLVQDRENRRILGAASMGMPAAR